MKKSAIGIFTGMIVILVFFISKESFNTMESLDETWLYQLQNLNVDDVAASNYKIVVMDPTREGTDETRYTYEEIALLKSNGITPIAYLSIGEASYFRTYWKKEWGDFQDGKMNILEQAPIWIGREPNPNWPESVKVRYWEDDWWEIVQSELVLIQEAGFEGVYLDIVDAFEYWGEMDTYKQNKEIRLSSDPTNMKISADRMVQFVEKVSNFTKESNASFMVIPQNAENILEFDNGKYLKAVDGIGVESTWFNEKEKIKMDIIEDRLSYLRQFKKADKVVLSVDYVDEGSSKKGRNKKRIDDYLQKCWKEGFHCYVGMTDRELDRLN